MSKRWHTTRSWETHDVSLREGGSVEQASVCELPCQSRQSTNGVSSVACVCSIARKSTSRDVPDTSGGTPATARQTHWKRPRNKIWVHGALCTTRQCESRGTSHHTNISEQHLRGLHARRRESHVPWPRTLNRFPATSTHSLRRNHTCNSSPCRHSCHFRMHQACSHQCSRKSFLTVRSRC